MKDNPGAITAAGSIWRCERARREAPGRADGHKRENGHLIEMIFNTGSRLWSRARDIDGEFFRFLPHSTSASLGGWP